MTMRAIGALLLCPCGAVCELFVHEPVINKPWTCTLTLGNLVTDGK